MNVIFLLSTLFNVQRTGSVGALPVGFTICSYNNTNVFALLCPSNNV